MRLTHLLLFSLLTVLAAGCSEKKSVAPVEAASSSTESASETTEEPADGDSP